VPSVAVRALSGIVLLTLVSPQCAGQALQLTGASRGAPGGFDYVLPGVCVGAFEPAQRRVVVLGAYGHESKRVPCRLLLRTPRYSLALRTEGIQQRVDYDLTAIVQ
jgi:hypothetical protein